MKTGKTTVDSVAAMLATNAGQLGVLSVAMVVAGLLSVFFEGRDANRDLLNYRFYNPWAFMHGRLGCDLAPAQLQSYLNPHRKAPGECRQVASEQHLDGRYRTVPAGKGALMSRNR